MKRVSLAVIGILLSAPAWAHGGGHFTPHDTITPPYAHSVGSFRPHDTITPPYSYARPSDTITPPYSHGTIDSVSGPLVKPAWKD